MTHTTSEKIVILHGWGALAPTNIQALVEELRSKGHEVYAPHLPGFGDSENPPQSWSVSDYVDWVIQQVDRKGWNTAVFCGHSFGGRIAIKLAVLHPERVSRLVLIASAGIKHELSFKAKLVRGVGSVGRFIFNLPGVALFQPVVHSLWRTILGRKDYYKVSGVMQQTFLKVIEEDLRGIIPQITKPTLVLWGKKDSFVPIS
ncbi:alpha/beta hydrolase, partial [candidate division WWE3 bacterium]|nr:alpha/beta hydrolase [candidate division WWE3 bacterium]